MATLQTPHYNCKIGNDENVLLHFSKMLEIFNDATQNYHGDTHNSQRKLYLKPFSHTDSHTEGDPEMFIGRPCGKTNFYATWMEMKMENGKWFAIFKWCVVLRWVVLCLSVCANQCNENGSHVFLTSFFLFHLSDKTENSSRLCSELQCEKYFSPLPRHFSFAFSFYRKWNDSNVFNVRTTTFLLTEHNRIRMLKTTTVMALFILFFISFGLFVFV